MGHHPTSVGTSPAEHLSVKGPYLGAHGEQKHQNLPAKALFAAG
eukprot:COSAG02_NODE_53093_length_304_cov_0.497561_1_plen_43_part_01